MVTEQELFDLLKEHHWTKQVGIMEGGSKAYRAKKRIAGKLISRYLCTEKGLKDIAPDDILEKLNRPAKQQTQPTEHKEPDQSSQD